VSDRRLAGSGWRVPATVPATPGRVPDSRSDPACGWCATIPSDFAVVSSVRRRLANWLEHRTVERGSRRSRFSLYEHWSTPQSTLTKGDWATSNSPLSAPTITSSSPSPTTVGDPTAPGNRGRGLPLMYRLADDVHVAVDRDHPGTTISLRWSLSAPNPCRGFHSPGGRW
jgi:hypothetical protein